jgi:hypothetical protein
MYSPVLLYIYRSVVVILHRRIMVGLITASVVAGMIHVRVLTTCLRRLP